MQGSFQRWARRFWNTFRQLHIIPSMQNRADPSLQDQLPIAGLFAFWAVFGPILLLAPWTLFSTFVAPALIEDMYRGDSLSFLNDIISRRDTYPLQTYLAKWEKLSQQIVSVLVIIALVPLPVFATGCARRTHDRTRLFRTYVVMTIFNIAIISAIYVFIPTLRPSLTTEDQFIENLTAVVFFTAFLTAVIRITTSNESHRLAYAIVPLLGLIGFLDELSFGQRFFGLKAQTIRGVNIDAVHDVLLLAPDTYGVLLGFLLLTLSVLTLVVIPKTRIRIRDAFKRYPRLRFLPFFAAFGLAALALDLHLVFIRPPFFIYLEEMFEMNAALALLFMSFAAR